MKSISGFTSGEISRKALDAVIAAEAPGSSGEAKKEQALTIITKSLHPNTTPLEWLGWFITISKIINGIVSVLNDVFGHDWGEKKSGPTPK